MHVLDLLKFNYVIFYRKKKEKTHYTTNKMNSLLASLVSSTYEPIQRSKLWLFVYTCAICSIILKIRKWWLEIWGKDAEMNPVIR